jgi:hypothetical protein
MWDMWWEKLELGRVYLQVFLTSLASNYSINALLFLLAAGIDTMGLLLA